MKVIECFTSIDGEINAFHQGYITRFIRLFGCNLACPYCDTKYAMGENLNITVTPDFVWKSVRDAGVKKVTITGGEPLLQEKEVGNLIEVLYHQGIYTSIETNGTIDIASLKWEAMVNSWIIDCKGPSSNAEGSTVWGNLENSSSLDWIKHIISGHEDYVYARKVVRKYPKKNHAFSPINMKIEPLIEAMIKDRLSKVLVNVQIHKLLNVK